MSLLRSWSRFQRASYRDFAPTELGTTVTESVCGKTSSAGLGIFYFRATGTPRATDADQMRLAAENVPSQGAISIANAIQALSIRH